MARERDEKPKRRVSLDDDDAIDRGLFSSGRATVKESFFGKFDYGGFQATCWIVQFERDGEKYDQPYSIGQGWTATKDGKDITNKTGDPGLPKNCNAILHLVKPLKAALKAAGIDNSVLAEGDPTVIEGMEVVVERVAQTKRDNMPKGRGGRGGRDRDRDRDRGRGKDGRDDRDDEREGREGQSNEKTILQIEEVISAPWDKGSGKSKKRGRDEEDEAPRRGKAKAEPDEDDEEEETKPSRKRASRDEEPEEKPRHRNRKTEEDDEEEAPARGKSRGRGKADEDEEDESDDEKIAEAGVEALLAALDKGAVKYNDLEKALAKATKGEKDQDAIIEWAMDKRNLKTEKGWSFNGSVLELD